MAACDIIVHVPGHWYLARPCLDAILLSTPPVDYELHVIDDSGDPFIAAELQRLADTHHQRVVPHETGGALGAVASMNLGLQAGNAPLVAFVAIDTIVSPGWLRSLIECIDPYPSVAAASPVSHAARATELRMRPGTNLPRMHELLVEYYHPPAPRLDALENFCFVLRRESLARVGYFDEMFEAVEDVVLDYSRRILSDNAELVCASQAYVYRSGTYSVNDDLDESLRARSAELLASRWGDTTCRTSVGAALPAAMIELQQADLLPQRDPDAPPLRAGDPLEILCILPTLNPYGGVISVVNLLNNLSELGHRCNIVSLSKCDNHPHVLYCEPEWVRDRTEIPDRYAGEYDIVLATSWETVDAAHKIASRSERCHPMYFIQDLEDQFYDEGDSNREAVLATYPLIDTKFAKTAYLCDAMVERGWPTHKIRPGMNLDLFYPRPTDPDRPLTVLGMVRYGHFHRGYDLVLETLHDVVAKRPNTRVILFGADDIPEGAVSFDHIDVGRVSPRELPWVYSSADVFLEMSRHHGFGRTGVEAMACGAACVLSNSGGLSAYAQHEGNALIVPVEDTEAATMETLRLLDDTALRQRLVHSGFETASRHAELYATQDFLNVVYRTHPAFQTWRQPAEASSVSG